MWKQDKLKQAEKGQGRSRINMKRVRNSCDDGCDKVLWKEDKKKQRKE